jgi:hypothetical protein
MNHDYVKCKCTKCGWSDWFRDDFVENGKVIGYCEKCDDETTFKEVKSEH